VTSDLERDPDLRCFSLDNTTGSGFEAKSLKHLYSGSIDGLLMTMFLIVNVFILANTHPKKVI